MTDRDTFRPIFGSPIGPWFRWFAWRPVYTTDRGMRWLRPVWRRRCQSRVHLPGPMVYWFQNVVTDPRGGPREAR